MKKLIILFVLFSSCDYEPKPPKNERYKVDNDQSKYGQLEIVKVRDCDYVLWHNGYGSDMEHYEGCLNPLHY